MHHIEVEQDEPRGGKEHQEKAQEPETHLLFRDFVRIAFIYFRKFPLY